MKRYFQSIVLILFVLIAFFPIRIFAASVTPNSTAFGEWSTAPGENAFAAGHSAYAEGTASVAMGGTSEARGDYSFTMGINVKAYGNGSVAMGSAARTDGVDSVAIGPETTSEGDYSFAIGRYLTASGESSTVFGTGSGFSDRLTNDRPSSFMIAYMSSATDTAPEFFVKDGAVGIGTKYPTEKLTIDTNPNSDSKILFLEGGAPFASLFYEGSAGVGANNEVHLRCERPGYEASIMTWRLDGNVAIGTTDPGQKLDIAGGNGRVETGYNWLTNSDHRLKKNISTLEGSLEKISRLRGVRFDSKEAVDVNKGDGKHIGVIAQELEKEYPELVVGDKETGYKAVAYDKLTAVLIEAVKEMKAQNEKQQVEIEELRSMISELKS